ncbi:glucans biosynthesis protein MdoC [Frankia sp. AgKG'84/4]|uniref:glucans biosynthesis protein MdoC n=1 Tax=Frankia sp. AgKG'84/4 TaxID=573490 RepID=UPI00200E05E0|nr:glucans biosynthesis protein MdoC [Frankia sp. AgKG'84/4]MCL9796251.1 glucans biosynthesis protein MdoC [Frankia sp. AgKG'84/4]
MKESGKSSGSTSGSDVHYHHLDALRGMFMLIGVFVHASTLGHDTFFHGIAYASSLFRMEGFFLISGFLSVMLVQKYGAGKAVRRRLAAVGTPLVCTFLLLNPVTLWMTYNFHNNPDISFLDFIRGRTIPHPEGELHPMLHLWFLGVLLVYALCTPAIVTLMSRLVATSAFARATEGRLRMMTAIISGVVAITIVLHGARRAVVEPVLGASTAGDLVKFTLEFLPFFTLGVLLYLDRSRLLPLYQRPAPVLLAVSGAALLAAHKGWVPGLASGTGLVLSETVVSIALTATLFAIGAKLVPGPRASVRYLADASYTVYLFHFFWIYIFATLLRLHPTLHWPQMLLVTMLTIAMTLAIHHFLIMRSAFLRKIFNGKFPARGRSTAQSAGPVAEPAPVLPVLPVLLDVPAVDAEMTLRMARDRRQVMAEIEHTQPLRWV